MDVNWQALVTGSVIVVTISYITSKARFSVAEGELKYGYFMKGFGILCLLISLLLLALLLTANYQVNKPGETISLLGLIIGFSAMAIYMIGEAFFVKGRFDQDTISFTSPWKGYREEKWINLESVSFNSFGGYHVLKFKTGKVIRISTFLGGYGYLVELLHHQGKGF